MHFPETSIENLRGFGYTEDEARFLYLVATHSGYFSTRQYLAFTGAKSGDKSVAFTQKVLGKGHATARLLLRNGRVYHLFSRLVYRAIAAKISAIAVSIPSNICARSWPFLISSWGISITGISKPRPRRSTFLPETLHRSSAASF